MSIALIESNRIILYHSYIYRFGEIVIIASKVMIKIKIFEFVINALNIVILLSLNQAAIMAIHGCAVVLMR